MTVVAKQNLKPSVREAKTMNTTMLNIKKTALVGALTLLGALGLANGNAMASAPKVGAAAPDFTVTDSNGKPHKLSQYKGKYVVLEWLNHGCPYVQKHYDSKNMQTLQKTWTGKGVVWLSVASSAPGKQGHEAGAEVNKTAKEKGSSASAILVDDKGTVGKAFDAKTTPHMFVIDPKGTLVYAGAIDSVASTDEDDLKKATNYVSQALTESMAGKKISVPTSKAYGCGVKYGD
jgi:peroxiredoxin